MAKWKNLEVGTRVIVKSEDKLNSAESSSATLNGTIQHREAESYDGSLHILVEFADGSMDWMHTDDVKLA